MNIEAVLRHFTPPHLSISGSAHEFLIMWHTKTKRANEHGTFQPGQDEAVSRPDYHISRVVGILDCTRTHEL